MRVLELDNQDRTLGRRELLIALGAVGAGALWQAACGSKASKAVTQAKPGASTARICVLTPEVTEGPYWIANHLTRRNITDNRPGLPLALRVTVLDASTCKPLKNADVEIWHADASGVYSGYSGNAPPSGPGGHATPDNAKRFLRGHQKTDAKGRAIFDTIYPGWYRGRAPHIHLKVHAGGSVVHVGQIFFPDRTSAAVYRTSRYRRRGEPDTTNGTDGIYAAAGGSRAKAKLVRRSGGRGFTGRITVGVRT